MNDLTHIDLFSGIGGFALAAQRAGFRTVAFCEIELFCQEVLKARFGAIANTKSERLERRGHGETRIKKKAVRLFSTRSIKRPILYSDIRDFDGSRFRGATLLTGGFPCQPFSHAGKRRGKEDDRAIWPQMLRVIHEARPAWVIGENVSGLISMELDQVLSDLEMEGYAARTFHIGAVGVNAPHRRMRVWIVGSRADAQDALLGRNGRWGDGDTPRLRRALQTPRPDSDAPDASCLHGDGGDNHAGVGPCGKSVPESGNGGGQGDAPDAGGKMDGTTEETITSPYELPSDRTCPYPTESGLPHRRSPSVGEQEKESEPQRQGGPRIAAEQWDIPWIEVASRLCGLDDELSAGLVGYLGTTEAHVKVRDKNRVQKLKALGNAIVPAVVFPIMEAIARIEREKNDL